MNVKINKIFMILFICLSLLFVFELKVDAASATIDVDKSTVEVGKPVKITVSGKGVQWNLKLKIDGEVLKTDSELENYEANENINFSVTYTPKTAGTKKITLEGSVTEFSDGSTIKSFSSKSITVKEKETTTVDKDTTTNKDTSSSDKDTSTTNKDTTTTEKPKEKSNNAYLSTLGVTPKEYDFSGFSKTKTEYSVTVPKNVDSLKVLYKTADGNAKVKVSGNSGFEVGSDNKITIKVTAEDGKTTKTYTIKVTQLAEEEEKPGNLIENEEGLYLKSLSIEGIDLSPEFAKDTYLYTAILSDASVSEVKVVAEANVENAKIDISGNTNLVEGENLINIVVKVEDSTVQKVYQIIVTKEIIELPAVTTNEEDNKLEPNDLIGKLKNYAGIAIGVVFLIIVAVIVLIILLIKENKKTREDDEIEDTKLEEYNVYKNDENEFANNDMSKDNFIESLYNQRNGNLDNEDLTEAEKETLEEISRQTEKIFEEKVEGQSVEYSSNDILENTLEKRKKRGKGKHSL